MVGAEFSSFGIVLCFFAKYIPLKFTNFPFFQDYVEPFIDIQRKGDGEIYDPMSLSKIQNRLRTNSYRHPLEFAADMRRIITETYRYTTPKDPLVDLAGKLQSEFEMCFAKIDFQVSLPKI